MSSYSGPNAANFFQAGSTCPFCQETIAEGQQVVACAACGSLHHDTCWQHKGGCSSYHCDTKVKAEGAGRAPEIVVTATEAERATVPPKPARLRGADAARPFLATGPKRLSWLAVASAVLAGLALCGLVGVVMRDIWIPVVGTALALSALAVGVVALVVINTSRKVYGFAAAGISISVAALLMVVYFVDFRSMWEVHSHTHQINLQIAESRPTEEALGQMAAPKARAMRANVVITSQAAGVFSMQLVTGSGVVLKVADKKAWILTNRHVVTGGDDTGTGDGRRLNILFYNGETSDATVAWLPPPHVDLAILECQALTIDKVEPIEVLSTSAAPGDSVFAVGNPENYYWSITEGIVSGMRNQDENGQPIEIYQTQTPINSGNSGGGLYTRDGRLIGVNTWTHDKSISEGLSFAISSRTLLRLLGDENVQKFLTAVPGTALPAPEKAVPAPVAPPAKPAETKP